MVTEALANGGGRVDTELAILMALQTSIGYGIYLPSGRTYVVYFRSGLKKSYEVS